MVIKLAHQNARESGQVLVIILLVMIVGLTSGLLLLGRTASDISLSTNIEESTRAFNAAEAGIEQAIRSASLGSSPVPVASGLTYQVSVSNLTGNVASGIYPESKNTLIKVGDTFTLWLVPHNDVTGALVEDQAQAYKQATLMVCFTGPSTPAIGITAYYKTGTNYLTSFAGYDGSSSRTSTNNFRPTAVSRACSDAGYSHTVGLNLATDFTVNLTSAGVIPLAFRIQPYYADAYIAAIPASGSFPKQGNKIESIGKSQEATRKIQVDEKYVVPAPFLDHVLFSYGASDLIK